jgi:hypothetical protein
MGALMREFPHIGMDTTCEHALAKLASSSRPSLAAAAASSDTDGAAAAAAAAKPPAPERLHFEASQQVPVALTVLLRDRQRLVAPTFMIQNTVEGRVNGAELLRAGQVSLPLYTAQHESVLLVQAGTFRAGGRTVRFPPCCRGRNCVGTTQRIRGLPVGGIVLMRAMSAAELQAMLHRGEDPPGDAPCVLCHRHTLASYVHNRRLLATTTADEGVFQLWHNSYDEAGGYHRDYMLLPAANEVLVSPLAESTYWGLEARPVPDVFHLGTSQTFWSIDQSAMVWSPRQPLLPHTGEALSHF